MKNATRIAWKNNSLVNPIIDMGQSIENVLIKGKYIAIKYHITPGEINSCTHALNLFYYGKATSEEWLL